MKNNNYLFPLILSISFISLLVSCSPEKKSDPFDPHHEDTSLFTETSVETSETSINTDVTSISEVDYGTFKITTSDGSYSTSGSEFTITKAGTYTLSGTIEEGNIFIEAGEEDEVILNLNDVSITSSKNSPIFAKTADSVKLYSDSGYENFIIDKREVKQEDDESQGNGAVYAKCDLSLTGKGTVNVSATFNNGVHSTKDLKVKNNTLTVNAVNNALKGNDSINIVSGNLNLIAVGGNGMITEDTDVSSKGNQRGDITINGGEINIYSCKDGIDAAHDLIINNEENTPKNNVYTSNYSSYSNENVVVDEESSSSFKYVKTTLNISSTYRFMVREKDTSGNYTWVSTSFFISQNESGGGPGGRGGTIYYYYKFNLIENVSSIEFYLFNASDENQTETYVAKSSSITLNNNYDTVKCKISHSGITIEGWTTYTTRQGGGGGWGDQGNTNKADYSAKGFKAHNTITIDAGTFYIKSYDDAIHANYGDAFDNELTGLGDVIINNGTFTIYAADDALHADRYLNINGGTINITNSYEGLEANVINVNGGDTTVYATDDGANAAKKAGLNVEINVNGGKLDITVASGDTDGIDSNGSFKQTGGIVVSRGSGSNMSTGLDCDGTASISGGTLLLFGRPEKTPTKSGSVQTQTITGTFGAGTYTFTCGSTTFTTTNKSSYSGVYIYSDAGNSFSYTKA